MPVSKPEEDDLIQGVYQPTIEPGITSEHKKSFKPWHRPRKHYIRIHQWCKAIKNLIKDIAIKNGDHLTYLGMPGEELLDIRTLHGVCQKAGARLRYLGFNSTAATSEGKSELNLANHEVASLNFIDPLYASVIKDRVERIAVANTMAYRRAADYGAFDVINLDLCDSIGQEDGEGNASYFEAIHQLCNLQMANRVKPWLLFLTTRAERHQIGPTVKSKLFKCVVDNATKHSDFATTLLEKLGLTAPVLTAEIDESELLAPHALISAFGLAIGKWLLGLLFNGNPVVKVELLKSYQYCVSGNEPDMLSLAFRITPLPQERTDSTGLTRTSRAAPHAPSESVLASELVAAITEIEDVDKILAKDPPVLNKMIEKCGKLLSDARYSLDEYRQWAASQGLSRPGSTPQPTVASAP